MTPPRRAPAALAAAAALLAAAFDAAAQDGGEAEAPPDPDRAGITRNAVVFGQSAAFNGPAHDLGENMRDGILAAFGEANFMGGVHGRRLELRWLDDAYEPESAVANTRRLIEEDGVFALIGAVGTPTSRAAAPIAAEAGVPYIAPFSGAAFLREPEQSNVINLRASYFQETETIVEWLVGDRGIDRVAVLMQDDSFGLAGYEGVRLALDRRGLAPVATGVYPRNTTVVKTALLDLRNGDPGAVVLIGAYRPVATLVSWARQIGFNPIFITISFVGSNALAEALGDAGAGVVATQVVPFPTAFAPRIASTFREALVIHAPGVRPGFVAFEGYLAGRMAIYALERCGAEPGRRCFVESLRSGEPIDLDGFELLFGDGDNQGSDAVFLSVIDDDGRFQPIEALVDPARS